MTRITIMISDQDKKALVALAKKEFRDPPSQAAMIIRLELQRQGLIELAPITSTDGVVLREPANSEAGISHG